MKGGRGTPASGTECVTFSSEPFNVGIPVEDRVTREIPGMSVRLQILIGLLICEGVRAGLDLQPHNGFILPLPVDTADILAGLGEGAGPHHDVAPACWMIVRRAPDLKAAAAEFSKIAAGSGLVAMSSLRARSSTG